MRLLPLKRNISPNGAAITKAMKKRKYLIDAIVSLSQRLKYMLK
jgi:hypothetical protein